MNDLVPLLVIGFCMWGLGCYMGYSVGYRTANRIWWERWSAVAKESIREGIAALDDDGPGAVHERYDDEDGP